jgi:hypothetical protein
MNSWVFNSTQTPLTKILMNSWVWNILETPLTKIWLMNSWVRNLGFPSAKLFTSKSFIETKFLLIHHYYLKISLEVYYQFSELILRLADSISFQPNTLLNEAEQKLCDRTTVSEMSRSCIDNIGYWAPFLFLLLYFS